MSSNGDEEEDSLLGVSSGVAVAIVLGAFLCCCVISTRVWFSRRDRHVRDIKRVRQLGVLPGPGQQQQPQQVGQGQQQQQGVGVSPRPRALHELQHQHNMRRPSTESMRSKEIRGLMENYLQEEQIRQQQVQRLQQNELVHTPQWMRNDSRGMQAHHHVKGHKKHSNKSKHHTVSNRRF